MDTSHEISNFRYIEKQIALAFAPPSAELVSEWSVKHRRLSRESSSTGGRWNNLPMQIEPMDSVLDRTVRTTVLMWASQTAGKTEVVNNIAGYFIHNEPSPMLMLQPTLEMAETWSKDRFGPMVRDTPCLREMLGDNKQKSSDTSTILHKKFRGGHLTIAGSNSPASLASRPIRVNLFDEEDRFATSAGKEGDPIALALKRSDTFWNSVDFRTSTPTIKGESRIEKDFEQSDKRYWYVKCPYCDYEQQLYWRNVRWDDEESIDKAYYVCDNQECKSSWSDLQRMAAIRGGRWIATAPFRGVRGYHLNGIYSLFAPKKGYVTRLHQMAVEFLMAKWQGKETFKVWINTFLAETWAEEVDAKPQPALLFARRESYSLNALPLGVRVITAGLDFQADRIEGEFVGYGVGEESWGLKHFVLWGDPKLPEIYDRLETILIQQFKREDGAVMSLKSAGFDTGYHACQRQLYRYLQPRLGRRYYAFKGSNQRNSEPISASSKSRVEAVKLIMVGTNRIKTYIYSRASISQPGPGYMHFADTYSEEWFRQLLVEQSRTAFLNGNSFKEFFMPETKEEGGTDRNEALDIRVYSLGALYVLGPINWDLEEKRNLATIPSEEDGESNLVNQFNVPIKRAKRKSRVLSGLLGNF